jgi:4-aminobutyrate aminotransferase-like enzyme
LDSPKLQRLLWADSGSAGIIKALWCAQHYQPDKPIILATRHGFHGKKGLAGDTTGAESENPNVRFISFPMYEHNETDLDTPEGQAAKAFYQNELNALWEEFPNKICALITEPYLGGAGSFHPPTWYLQLLNTWCEEHNVTFILDEVQSCHGRTGEMYAFQKHGIQPDMVVLGKGVGNGEPVAVTIGSEALIESLDYGEGSDTYSGNPHACAAILAVFDAYEKYAVVENCQKMSPIMMEGLQQLALDFDFVTEVRGEGLVFGVEMHDYGGKTAGEMANAAVRACYDQGLHLMGPLSGKVLRVSPPLIITEEQVKEGLTKMRQAFEQIS